MLLGVVLLGLVSSYLYREIAQGLVDGRVKLASSDSAALANKAQQQFDTTSKIASSAQLNQAASNITGAMTQQGVGERRYVVLMRTDSNNLPISVNSIFLGPVTLDRIPADLRAEVSATRNQQRIEIGTIDQDGEEVPAVFVGQQLQLPVAGPYALYFIYPMDRERDVIDLVGRVFTIGGLLIILLTGAIALVVTRLVVDPVQRAAAVAEKLADGHLEERMTPKGEDDLARLAHSFNEMADSLQQQIGQLEDLSRVQQRFVSDVSHELRTPLTTIRMAGDLIHDSRSSFDPVVARSAELLHNQLDRFESLLADLLEISRFDAGAAGLEVEEADLTVIAQRVVDGHQTLADAKGSVVTVNAPAQPVLAECDSRRVDRILRNLVSNAIEHGEGRPVEVSVASNDSAVAVSVRDHGVGLRPGEAGLVFTRFWRADPARARTTGGTGLGLAIALEDARLHGGFLEAWGAPGQGSCFRLTLPLHAETPVGTSPLPLNPLTARRGERAVERL